MSRLTWILVVSLAVLSPAGATVPARDEPPLPDETALLADLLENQSQVEQAIVNEEVWLPTCAEIEVFARLLLLKGVKQHQEILFSDYRKFSVDTSEDVRAPQP